MKPKTVKEIVEQYLEANGYDGLWLDDCGCRLGDLFPCGMEGTDDCRPGYLRRRRIDGEDVWMIGPKDD